MPSLRQPEAGIACRSLSFTFDPQFAQYPVQVGLRIVQRTVEMLMYRFIKVGNDLLLERAVPKRPHAIFGQCARPQVVGLGEHPTGQHAAQEQAGDNLLVPVGRPIIQAAGVFFAVENLSRNRRLHLCGVGHHPVTGRVQIVALDGPLDDARVNCVA
jgi:hypothetical protein